MSKGYKGGGGGNNQKSSDTGGQFNVALSPEQVRTDKKSFGEAMGEAAVTSATSLVATAAMYGIYAGARIIGEKMGWVTPKVQSQHTPRQPEQSGGDEEKDLILKYAGYAREELGEDADGAAIAQMVLDKNPDDFSNEKKVRGIIEGAVRGGRL